MSSRHLTCPNTVRLRQPLEGKFWLMCFIEQYLCLSIDAACRCDLLGPVAFTPLDSEGHEEIVSSMNRSGSSTVTVLSSHCSLLYVDT